jgi:hypothetical protein
MATATILALLATEALSQGGVAPDLLFQSSETLNATITAPMFTLARERSKEDYLPGTFEYTEADGTAVKFDIEIRTRGNYRHRNCKIPPLRLNFKKGQVRGTTFNKQDKLKLVVHCDNSERYEQMVLREYLIYKVLNLLTDKSFRTRLLRITYIDTDSRRKKQTRYAFLIEHDDRFAKRQDLKPLPLLTTTVASIQSDVLNLTSVFEYFIGNTDFSPVGGAAGSNCCHNYALLSDDPDKQIVVPYDFDLSGFVNAPYASANPRFKLRSVRVRLYRGRCFNNILVEASLETFREHRDEIYALFDNQEGIDSSSKKFVTRYTDDFFKLIDKPKEVKRRIIDKCI